MRRRAHALAALDAAARRGPRRAGRAARSSPISGPAASDVDVALGHARRRRRGGARLGRPRTPTADEQARRRAAARGVHGTAADRRSARRTASWTSRSTSTRRRSRRARRAGPLERLPHGGAGRTVRRRACRPRRAGARTPPDKTKRSVRAVQRWTTARRDLVAGTTDEQRERTVSVMDDARGRPSNPPTEVARGARGRRRASTCRSSRCSRCAVAQPQPAPSHGDGRFSPDGRCSAAGRRRSRRRSRAWSTARDLMPVAAERRGSRRKSLLAGAERAGHRPVPRAVARRRSRRRPGARSRAPSAAARRGGGAAFGEDGRLRRAARRRSRRTGRASRDRPAAQVADELRRFSLVAGVDPDPVGVTAWSQPWVPLWLEWEVELDTARPARRLVARPGRSRDRRSARRPTARHAHRDAAPLNTGTARDARRRDRGLAERRAASATPTTRARSTSRSRRRSRDIADAIAAARHPRRASLDRLHERLLGLPVDGFGVLRGARPTARSTSRPRSTVPQLLRPAAARLTRAQLVDAFGRTLDLPVDAAPRSRARRDRERAGALRAAPAPHCGPRGGCSGSSIRAPTCVSRTIPPRRRSIRSTPRSMVNPGGRVPPARSHRRGARGLRRRRHAARPAHARAVRRRRDLGDRARARRARADAGPLHGLGPQRQHCSALIARAHGRRRTPRARGLAASRGRRSPRSRALLRAVDTTLWTVDTLRAVRAPSTSPGSSAAPSPWCAPRCASTSTTTSTSWISPIPSAAPRARRRTRRSPTAPSRCGSASSPAATTGCSAFFVDDDYTPLPRRRQGRARRWRLDVGRGRGQLGQLGDRRAQMPDSEADHASVRRRRGRAARAPGTDAAPHAADAPGEQGAPHVRRPAAQGAAAGRATGCSRASP